MSAAPSRSTPPQPVEAPATHTPTPPIRRGPGKRGGIIVGVMLGLGGLAAGYHFLTAGQETTDDAQIEADVVPLAARVGGPITKVLVKENAFVKAGEPIVEIDPADYQVRVKQAEGELAAAKAQAEAADAQERVAEAVARGGFSTARASVSASTASVSNADAQVAAAKAALVRAQTDAKRAHLDLERAEQLRTANAIPQQKLDDARSFAASADAALDQARAQLNSAEEGKRVALSHVAEAQGQLDSSAPIDAKIAVAKANAELAHGRVTTAEAALEQAKLMLGYTHILAPIDGHMAKLDVHPGQLLAPGAPVGQLVPNEMYVMANFKETQIQQMRPGQKVEISVDALDGKLEGTVESLASGTGSRFALLPPDNASGNFVKVVQRVPVRIALSGKQDDSLLRAGLSADVTVYTR